MTRFIEQFHFLRPTWLLLLLPLLTLVWYFFHNRDRQNASDWTSYVDAHLLKHLAINSTTTKTRPYVSWVVMLASVLFVVGISGPTWQKTDMPSFTGNEPTVLVLSLAQSMNSDDIKPSRLQRSVHKIRDILAKTQGDERGLVIYSDTAFIATPLTDDAKIIEQMLPELSTTLMPVLGNRPDLGITTASEMLQRANAKHGRIVLLADNLGDDKTATTKAVKTAENKGYQVSILGVGTAKGALLQTADGQKITTQSGQDITMKLPISEMKKLASVGDGVFTKITANDSDVNKLLASNNKNMQTMGKKQSQKGDDWYDMGYWLLLFPMGLLAFAFRRNKGLFMLALALVIVPSILPQSAYAQSTAQSTSQISSLWNNLWKTPNQQGQQAFDKHDYQKASKLFTNKSWQGASLYRMGNYGEAIKIYQQQKQDYNLGNALAKSGDLQGALNAYNRYLKQNPKDKDAIFNRDLIKKLLEKQQQNKKNKNDKKNKRQQQQKQQGQKDKKKQKQQQGGKEKQEKKEQQGQKGKQDQKNKQAQKDNQKQKQQQGGKEKPKKQEQQGEKAKQKAKEQQAQQPKEKTDKQGKQPISMNGIPPLDQATEQELRHVPDNPSGLLKARIYQHYYGK